MMNMKGEFGSMGMKIIVAYLKVFSRHSPRDIKGNHKISQSGYL